MGYKQVSGQAGADVAEVKCSMQIWRLEGPQLNTSYLNTLTRTSYLVPQPQSEEETRKGIDGGMH